MNLLAEDNFTKLSKIKYALIEAENVQNIKSEDLVWKDFSEVATTTASNTEGKKTIFVIYKDEAGNVSLSIN